MRRTWIRRGQGLDQCPREDQEAYSLPLSRNCLDRQVEATNTHKHAPHPVDTHGTLIFSPSTPYCCCCCCYCCCCCCCYWLGLGDVDSRVPSPNIMSAPGTPASLPSLPHPYICTPPPLSYLPMSLPSLPHPYICTPPPPFHISLSRLISIYLSLFFRYLVHASSGHRHIRRQSARRTTGTNGVQWDRRRGDGGKCISFYGWWEGRQSSRSVEFSGQSVAEQTYGGGPSKPGRPTYTPILPFFRCIPPYQHIPLAILTTSPLIILSQAKLHGGKHIAGQKDRDIPIGMISPSARTHLPAPGYGYTTGHGLIGANDRSVNGGGQLNSASFTSNSPIPTTSSTSKISTGGGKKSDSDGGVIIKERPDIARQILR